ncbi:MAG: TolC family protein [Planctomycetia bacterium]|nr:TolC family protein [Planctomycetia bacterium]
MKHNSILLQMNAESEKVAFSLVRQSKRSFILRMGAGLLAVLAGTVSVVSAQTEPNLQVEAESVARSGSILTSSDNYLTGMPVVHRQTEKLAQVSPNPQSNQVPNPSTVQLGPVKTTDYAAPMFPSSDSQARIELPGIPSSAPVPAPIESTPVPYVAPTNAAIPTETLEAAQERAVSMSRKLQASGYKTDSARQKIAAARGVGLPKLANTTVAMALNEEPVVTSEADLSQLIHGLPPIQVNTPVAEKEFAASVTSVTIPLYLGGRVRAMVDSATALTSALQSGQQIDELDLRLKVAETYFMVLRVRSLLQIAQEAERTAAAHLKDAKRYFETGLVTKNVLLAADVAYSNTRQDVVKANNAVQLVQAAYNRLLWRNLQDPVSLADMDIPVLSGPLEPLTGMAVRCRPELAALAAESQALAAQGRVQQANVLPQVALVGQVS